jgi:hypothetical protein
LSNKHIAATARREFPAFFALLAPIMRLIIFLRLRAALQPADGDFVR